MAEAPRRRLRVFAWDPLVSFQSLVRDSGDDVLVLDVPWEDLDPGPVGRLVQVQDFDSTRGVWYRQVDLDAAEVVAGDGLRPDESDPRFHQQSTYAVVSRVVEGFERALGRRITFARGRRLRVLPHAFEQANAFYEPGSAALLFGYFRADREHAGAALPGQWVFTSLSHDIVAHETAHALLHRLSPHLLEPTNPDVLSLHEAVADMVALFQHFTVPGLLEREVAAAGVDLRRSQGLVEVARQFGHARGTGTALRSALDEPDPARLAGLVEPHDRGEVLVAAVFEAFFGLYAARTRDLAATSTALAGQAQHGLVAELVPRAVDEAARAAAAVQAAVLRAFEYMPPVDADFGDFLRSFVTADTELRPEDPGGLRAKLVEACRRRGIYPPDVPFLGEASLRWPDAPAGLPRLPGEALELALAHGVTRSGLALVEEATDAPNRRRGRGRAPSAVWRALHAYAADHAEALGLAPPTSVPVQVAGFHPTWRVDSYGQLRTEVVVRYVQTVKGTPGPGGLPQRGGTTVVLGPDGAARYVVASPLDLDGVSAGHRVAARARAERTAAFVAAADAADARLGWESGTGSYARARMARRYALGAVHRSAS